MQAKPLSFRYRIDCDTDKLKSSLFSVVGNIVSKRHGNAEINESFEMVAKWLNGGTKPWLLLTGQPGNGKTTMTLAIKEVMEMLGVTEVKDGSGAIHRLGTTNTNVTTRPCKVKVVSALGLADIARDDTMEFMRIKSSEFLIIDDIGTEPVMVKNFGNEISPVVELLYQRYNNMSFTIMNSNIRREQIGERYGARINDRMNEVLDVIPIINNSYRGGAQWK